MKVCIVCRQAGAKQQLIDGVPCDICDKCALDAFRRAEAVKRALQR